MANLPRFWWMCELSENDEVAWADYLPLCDSCGCIHDYIAETSCMPPSPAGLPAPECEQHCECWYNCEPCCRCGEDAVVLYGPKPPCILQEAS